MIAAFVVMLGFAVPYELFAEAAGYRYGRIVITGNVYTPDLVILEDYVPLRPGQKIVAADVRSVRAKLRASGLFTSAALELIPNEFDSTYIDLKVSVGDKIGNWYFFSLPLDSLGIACQLPGAFAEQLVSGTHELLSVMHVLTGTFPQKRTDP